MKVYLDNALRDEYGQELKILGDRILYTPAGANYLFNHYSGIRERLRPDQASDETRKHLDHVIEKLKLCIVYYETHPAKPE